MHRIKTAWNVLTRRGGVYAPEVEGEDGWTDFIHPSAPRYLLECCDCGLIHEMGFHIGPSDGVVPDEALNPGETQQRVIWFRARRI